MTPQTLLLHSEFYCICRLAPETPQTILPPFHGFHSITRTPNELSVVCQQNSGVAAADIEKDWRLIELAGPLDFALTGVLHGLTEPLAKAGVSIFAISTFDTDYVLVRDMELAEALTELDLRGYHVTYPY